jgi:iron complex transport system substrate-binding protein
MPRCIHNLARLALTAALLAAATGAAYCDPIVVKDAAGQLVTIRDNSRIVSIGGAITEILYALGLDHRVVAIDSTSFYPPQALREKPNVGYMRALSPEGVLGLNPSLILATEDAGPKETITVLRAAGIPFVLVPDKYSGRSILEKIEIVAAAAGGAERGRLPRQGGRCRPRRTGADPRPCRAAAEGNLPALLRERPGDGRGPRDSGRRHHQARRREQRHRRL